MELKNRKVTIMGLGLHGGGVSAAKYCAQAGAMVTITDLAREDSLAESLAQLSHLPIAKYALGKHHEEDFRTAEVVIVNPAVKPANRFVQIARQSGAEITSEIELFLNACPATVIGVTGTVGKSTTAAMTAAILQAAGRTVWLGGNIGHSLLGDLPRICSDDLVVLELSSFQLHWLNETAHWPKLAIVTNCAPNHLDWHGHWEQYRSAKQRLLRQLPAGGFAVLNLYDPEVAHWRSICGWAARPQRLETLPTLQIPGEHNKVNAACAARMAKELGVDDDIVRSALADFAGLPHRLQYVEEVAGRRFYNDSKSTTPAATLAALNTMPRRTWLLLGGVDAQHDFSDLAKHVADRATGAAVFGAAAAKLDETFRLVDQTFPCHRGATLPDALAWCWQQSQPGDAILLSPACPSVDQFQDFAHRGEAFRHWVQELSAQNPVLDI